MAKFFARLGAEKVTCNIFLVIHNVEADVQSPLNMTIMFCRGPQKEESLKFKISPQKRIADIS